MHKLHRALKHRQGKKEITEMKEIQIIQENQEMKEGVIPSAIARVLQIAGMISVMVAITRVVTDLIRVVSALKEQMAGRTIDLKKVKSPVRALFQKHR